MNYRLTILCVFLIAICVHNSPITSLTISAKGQRNQGCLIAIQNTNEMLDIRSTCQKLKATDGNCWETLIFKSQSYVLEDSQYRWKGYRYFKNPAHYKNVDTYISFYEGLLKQLLAANSLNIELIFDDKYSLLLEQNAEGKWNIAELNINYAFNLIEKIEVDSEHFDIRSSSNQTSNIQTSFATRKISGKGLHQKVNLTIALDLEASLHLDQTCKVVIEQILPESTYIDVDQLRSVKKFEVINIQLPEPASKQYYYQYTIPFSKFTHVGSRRYNYLYPIHFRYPAPSHLNYTLVALHPSDKIQLVCKNGSKTVQLPEDLFNNRGHASIFNGSSHDTKTVSMVTFVLMVIAAMIIIKQLRKI